MIVYRTVKQRYADDLTGTGASIAGGRWNRKGTPLIYASTTPELALLEYSVHLTPMRLPAALMIIEIEMRSKSILHLRLDELLPNWHEYPAPDVLADMGSLWATSQKSLALMVPSAVMPMSSNCLINPNHTHMKYVSIKAKHLVRYDPRIKAGAGAKDQRSKAQLRT